MNGILRGKKEELKKKKNMSIQIKVLKQLLEYVIKLCLTYIVFKYVIVWKFDLYEFYKFYKLVRYEIIN